MNNALKQLDQPQGRCLTAILANCGDSGSPKYEEIYFVSQAKAEQWVADPNNAHRLKKADPESTDKAPAVTYRQVEAWIAGGKYHICRGTNSPVEIVVIS